MLLCVVRRCALFVDAVDVERFRLLLMLLLLLFAVAFRSLWFVDVVCCVLRLFAMRRVVCVAVAGGVCCLLVLSVVACWLVLCVVVWCGCVLCWLVLLMLRDGCWC